MKINFNNYVCAPKIPVFKGEYQSYQNNNNGGDNFMPDKKSNLPPGEFITKRLSNLKEQDGSNLVPGVAISLMLRECNNITGLSDFIQGLRENVLCNINWHEFANTVADKQPDYSRCEKNAAFMNSLNPQTLAKFDNPSDILFSTGIRFDALGEILRDLNTDEDDNIRIIHTKFQHLPNNETKNVYRFCDEDDNLLAKETVLIDSDGKIILKEHEKILTDDNGKKSIRRIEDRRLQKSHLVNSNISDISIKTIIPNFELCIERDNDDNIQKISYRSKSKVPGAFNVLEIIPGYDPANVAFASQSEDEIHIRKKIDSFEGVSTLYSLDAKEDGSRNLSYIITDADGKILLDKKTQITKIDDNTYTTNVNGRCFITRYSDNAITINDLSSGNSHKFELENFLRRDHDRIAHFLITLEAPELIRLFKNSTAFIETRWNFSHYNQGESFDISSDLSIFDICHELGHATDYNNGNIGNLCLQLSTRDEFIKTFSREAKIFLKNSTVTQRDYLRHLIGTKPRTNYAKEAFAESNGILNYIQQHDETSSRAECFQQYFPRTIACVHKILNE